MGRTVPITIRKLRLGLKVLVTTGAPKRESYLWSWMGLNGATYDEPSWTGLNGASYDKSIL
jgi:hypothetical protein